MAKVCAPAQGVLPGIVRFLGYTPWAAGGVHGERLLAYRWERGLSQALMARRLGIDPGTLSRWERNLPVPTGKQFHIAEVKTGVQHCARDTLPQ